MYDLIIKDLVERYRSKLFIKRSDKFRLSSGLNGPEWKNCGDYNIRTVKAIARAAGLFDPRVGRANDRMFINDFEIFFSSGSEDAQIESIFKSCLNLES